MRLTFTSCLCIVLCTLTGCIVVGPKYHRPAATEESLPSSYKEIPAHYKNSEGWDIARPRDAMLRGEWWRVFNDPDLNALEEQLNINNQNIKEFFQNFMEARTLIAEANAQLYPTLTANASWTKARTPPLNPITTILSTLEISWAPDVWGKVRNAIRSAQYSAQLSAADLENEKLIEQATLATVYFQIRGQDTLQQLFNDTIVAFEKALAYNQVQYETGITDKISVVEAQNTLENAEASATNIGVARAQFEHAIAVLLGRVASNFSIPVRTLHRSPPSIPVGVPSQLLERRPDIAAAERAMASANAQIGQAYAAYFPEFNLSSDAGFESRHFSNLFDTNNRTWSIGPSASETIFDAGLRTATVHQFIATYNADLAAYRQTVLTGFQQVEDAMAEIRLYSKQIRQQRDAEKSAEEFLTLEMGRYQTGIDPYVDVVTAQTTLLTDQQAVITVQVLQMTSAVALIESLGGGWDVSELPTPAQVSKWPAHEESKIQQ